MHSTAYLVYRTLRRSGIRWAMWAPAPSESPAPDEARAEDRGPVTGTPTRAGPRRGADAAASAALRGDATGILGTVLIVLAMLAVIVLPAITTSTVVHLLGGAAALIALVLLASLVRLVVTDVRAAFRERAHTPFTAADVVRSSS